MLQPAKRTVPWHIGWRVSDGRLSVSLIPLTGPVRILRGPGSVEFFALESNGGQIKLQRLGRGVIGDGSKFAQLPLL